MNYTKIIIFTIIFLLVVIPVANAENSIVLTFYPNGTASDGRLGNRTLGAAIATMLLAPAGTGSVTTATPGNVSFIRNASAGKVNALTRYGMMFNTSNISRQGWANWTVTNASMQLYGTAISTSAGQINMSCTQFIPASNISLVVGDYGTNKTYKCGPDLSVWSTSGYNILYFDTTGLGFINPTGFTNIMARSRNDTESAIPVGSVAASSLSFRSSAYSGTSQDPKLVIVVNESMSMPNGSFTTSETTGYAPKVMLFNSTTTGLPDIYNWSFGDGTWGNGTDFNTSHTYSNTGTYTVFLITKNGVGSNQSANTTITLIGANITTIQGYKIIQYEVPGTVDFTIPANVTNVSYLVIAGGGAGGNSNNGGGGGGGGGGFLNSSFYEVTTGQIYNISVGSGGKVISSTAGLTGPNGTNSSFGSFVAVYGGGGGGGDFITSKVGSKGGSGGGGGGAVTTAGNGGANISGQGWAGGAGSTVLCNGGGGGGAGSVGDSSGNAGSGLINNNITFSDIIYSPGGLGGNLSGSSGSISPYIGGGGSGAGDGRGVNGTTGIVIIRYFDMNPAVPVAGFMTNITSGIGPVTVSFIDTSSGVPTKYNWSWGDGTWDNTTSGSTIHTFQNLGNFTVKLLVSNGLGSNITPIGINITVISPVTSFTANQTSVAYNQIIQFTDTSTGNSTGWYWEFGDGSNSTDHNPTHAYSYCGNYTVNLTLTNYLNPVKESKSEYIHVYGSLGLFRVTDVEGVVWNNVGTFDGGNSYTFYNTSSPKFGNAAMEINSTNNYVIANITNATSATFPNSQPFTYEFFIKYPTGLSLSSDYQIFNVSRENQFMYYGISASGGGHYKIPGTIGNDNIRGDWRDGTWHHVVYEMNSTTSKIFLDGTIYKVGYEDTSSISGYTGFFAIPNGFYDIDELRISNIERYPNSTAFTPPTEEFVSDVNTISLTHFNIESGDGECPGEGGDPPIVQWLLNKNVVRVPGTVVCNDTSLNTPTAWQYYWGDGTSNTTTNNATHKYTKRGVYQVTLNATNAAGSNTSVSKQVRVFGGEVYAY